MYNLNLEQIKLLAVVQEYQFLRQDYGTWYIGQTKDWIESKLLKFLLREGYLFRNRKEQRIVLSELGTKALESLKHKLIARHNCRFPSVGSEVFFRGKRGYLLQVVNASRIYIIPDQKNLDDNIALIWELYRPNPTVAWKVKGKIPAGVFLDSPVWEEILKYDYFLPKEFYQENKAPKNTLEYYQNVYEKKHSLGLVFRCDPNYSTEDNVVGLLNLGFGFLNQEHVLLRLPEKIVEFSNSYSWDYDQATRQKKQEILSALKKLAENEKEAIDFAYQQYFENRINQVFYEQFFTNAKNKPKYQIPSLLEVQKTLSKFQNENYSWLIEQIYNNLAQKYQESKTKILAKNLKYESK